MNTINRRSLTTIVDAPSTRPHSRRRRQAFTIVLLAGAFISAWFGAAGTTHASTPPSRMCFMSPAADGQPFGADLVSMYRTQANEMQLLHRVECTDQTITYRWISANSALGG
jgi:hypothetical protein